jgi:Ankyrin repeats (many copies)
MLGDDALIELMRKIALHDRAAVAALLDADAGLSSARLDAGATRQQSVDFFLTGIQHHVYRGDTAVHVAAAASEPAIIRALVERGGRVDATNRRGAQPLHYAVNGTPGSLREPDAQHQTVSVLIELGADPNVADKNGTTPLLRAIRNRNAAAVEALLDRGADPRAKNKSGSTALQLASWTTGKSGSGSPRAKTQQQEIIRLLRAAEERDATSP